MLMTLLVVQAPIATVDRLLHDTGHAHAANAFVGAVVDLPEHEHNFDRQNATADQDEQDPASIAPIVADAPPSDPATPDLNHHHHHDSASVYGLPESSTLAVAWSSSALPFRLDDDLRKGIDAFQQDRPPKALLVHVA